MKTNKFKAQASYDAKMKAMGFTKRGLRVHDDDWLDVRAFAANLRQVRIAKGVSLKELNDEIR